MTDKEELTIKIPKDENEKAILARKAKEAKAKEKAKEAKEDTNSAGCMSFFFCCALFQ